MIGRPRVHFRVTDSTNERARALAAAGAPHGTIVTADEQSAGRVEFRAPEANLSDTIRKLEADRNTNRSKPTWLTALEQVRLADKLWAASVARLVPIPLLGRFLPGLRGDHLDATATVIFTSAA